METQIAGSIARMDGSTSQDAIFKDVLAYKEVLAHIMKTCVPEYKDCTIPQIIGYIEPNPQVGQVGLHPDETNPPKIQGMSTESTTTTEERVVYDVRFSAVAPGEDGKIGLIINIEAQSKYHPGYPLVKRAIYYCGQGNLIACDIHEHLIFRPLQKELEPLRAEFVEKLVRVLRPRDL